jgi:hypothetical protein
LGRRCRRGAWLRVGWTLGTPLSKDHVEDARDLANGATRFPKDETNLSELPNRERHFSRVASRFESWIGCKELGEFFVECHV